MDVVTRCHRDGHVKHLGLVLFFCSFLKHPFLVVYKIQTLPSITIKKISVSAYLEAYSNLDPFIVRQEHLKLCKKLLLQF